MLVCMQVSASAGDDPFRGPWQKAPAAKEDPNTRPPGEKNQRPSAVQRMAVRSIRFFQDVISPVDGDRCPMVPSCSAYGIHAIERHGFLLGTIMVAARLTHERGEMMVSPTVRTAGGYRFYDPVESNDFWFAGNGNGGDDSGALRESPSDRRSDPHDAVGSTAIH